MTPRVLAIVGPTAAGKTRLAIEVATRVGGEVISLDSMQAYQGMNIGTATPSMEERAGVAHHMFDVWPISHPLTVVEFRDAARAAIEDVWGRGRVPIAVGGSGLYVRAVLENLDPPGTDTEVRASLEERLAESGPRALHEELGRIDPAAAAVINPMNGRRIVRALEVNAITGGPFQANLPEPQDRYRTTRVGIAIDRTSLDARIEARVDDMWRRGMVDEVRNLLAQGLAEAPTARAALGYGPVMDSLAGEISEEQARMQTWADTKKFARRQQRWFAADSRTHWVEFNELSLVDDVVSVATRT
ncbi:MAG: tRNA (adenosine(37)-N6)-dimethylallyltransferase MiaA [Actinomycetota bacterium]